MEVAVVGSMTTNHTPTPWIMDTPLIDGIHCACISTTHDAGNLRPKLIASCVPCQSLSEQVANARLIVRAVNSHQTLVDALQAIVAILDGRQPKDAPGALMVAKSALAALALANT